MRGDRNLYLVSDYSATGEGHTIMLMITRAFPRPEDYDRDSEDVMSLTKTPTEIAIKQFKNKYGEWFADGVEVLDRFEFFDRYGAYVPNLIQRMCDPDGDSYPPTFSWDSTLHINL